MKYYLSNTHQVTKILLKQKFEDIKVAIKRRKSKKDRQYNCQNKKYKQ